MEEYGLRSKVLWEVKSNIRWKKLKDTRLGTKIPRTYTHKIEVSERLCIVILVFILVGTEFCKDWTVSLR